MLKNFTGRVRDEAGFTLIELLVVITILGILAAVVVFSVGGIGDKGQDAACATDLTTIQVAQEAFAGRKENPTGDYAADKQALKDANLLSTVPTLHNTTGTAKTVTTPSTFTITGIGKCVGSNLP